MLRGVARGRQQTQGEGGDEKTEVTQRDIVEVTQREQVDDDADQPGRDDA